MTVFRVFSKFKKMTPHRRWILCEAMANTMVAWTMIRLLPYKLWKRWLGNPVPLGDLPPEISMPGPNDGESLADIAWAHRRLSTASRETFTCLMLGFSARAMLRRRGCESVLVLGVARNGTGQIGALGAHAWLVHQQFDIAGGRERHEYAPVAAYGNTHTVKAIHP